jgi:hypothetical protein
MHKVTIDVDQVPAIRKRSYLMAVPDFFKQAAGTSQLRPPRIRKHRWLGWDQPSQSTRYASLAHTCALQ